MPTPAATPRLSWGSQFSPRWANQAIFAFHAASMSEVRKAARMACLAAFVSAQISSWSRGLVPLLWVSWSGPRQ